MGQYSPDWYTRNGVHYGLFISAISSQGSEEQVDRWVPQGMSLALFGCFAMTELRGGSNLRALETTAVYHAPGGAGAHPPPPAVADGGPPTDNDIDPSDGWYELHTPSITALKW